MAKAPGPSGRMVEVVSVDFEQTAEPWCTITLEDGSVLKAKLVITGVVRFEDERDTAGNPIYSVHKEIVVRVVKAGKGLRGEPTFGLAPKTKAEDSAVGYR